MKTTSRSRVAIPIVLGIVVVAVSPVGATCVLPSTFNTGAYYTPAPIAANPGNVGGAFWGLGQGNPGGLGTDNGTYSASQWVRGPVGPNLYLAGDWSGSGLTHGCIQDPPNPQPAKMVVALSASDTGTRAGAQGYFAVMCVEENANGNFDFGAIQDANLPLVPIPKPVITQSTRQPGTIEITVRAPGAITAGVYQDGNCGAGLIQGYKLFKQNVARNSAAPAARNRTSGWIEASMATHPTTAEHRFSHPCTTNEDVYLALGLVFDSGFETTHLSENSTRIECGPNVSGKPDPFRLIKKPKGVRNP